MATNQSGVQKVDGSLRQDDHVAAHADAVAVQPGHQSARPAHPPALVDLAALDRPNSAPWAAGRRSTPVRAATCAASGPTADPVAGSSPISAVRRNERAW